MINWFNRTSLENKFCETYVENDELSKYTRAVYQKHQFFYLYSEPVRLVDRKTNKSSLQPASSNDKRSKINLSKKLLGNTPRKHTQPSFQPDSNRNNK